MRVFILLLATVITASAQTDLSKLLEQGMKEAVNSLKPVPAAEQKEVLTATATLLSKHVTFRPDGTASSTCDLGVPQPIEWRKLVVRAVHKQTLTDADRLNGITRRYLASLGCEASRSWTTKTSAWSEWRPTGFTLFPSAIVVEEKNGVLSARGNSQLPRFMPGPGPSITDKPATGANKGLPPGMTRGR